MTPLDNAAVCRSLADIEREEQRQTIRLQRRFARDNAAQIAAEWNALPDWQSEAEHARQHREAMTPEYRADLDRDYL